MTTVEMAIILPVALLMALGTVDLGRLFKDSVAVAGAARAGLSYGVLSEERAQNYTTIRNTAKRDAELVKDGITVSAENICECNNGTVVNCADGTCDEGGPKLYVKVTAQKSFKPIIPFPGIPETVSLQRVHYMRAR